MKNLKALSIITAQILALTSLGAVDDTNQEVYEWIIGDEGDYTFTDNFSQKISGNSGKGVVGIYSTATNTYTLKTNSQATFTSISNTSSQVLKTAYGLYSSGNTTLTLENSSILTFQFISSANDASYGFYSLKGGGSTIKIQNHSTLHFQNIKGKDAYGIWTYMATKDDVFIQEKGKIHFSTIKGENSAYGIASIYSSQNIFKSQDTDEGGIISFDNISASKSYVVSVNNEGSLGFEKVRVYYGNYANFDHTGNRSALYANLDDNRNSNLIFNLTAQGKSTTTNTALITTKDDIYYSLASTKGISRWLIAPSSNEVYAMYFTSSTQKQGTITIGDYALSLSTQGFGETTDAKQVALIYIGGNLHLDLSRVFFVDNGTQGATIKATNTAIGVLVGASSPSSPTVIDFKDKDTTFASVSGKDAYGLVLKNGANAQVNHLKFGTITGSEKSIGIAFEGDSSLDGNIAFATTPKTAIQIQSGAKASILGKIVFDKPQMTKTLINNQGELTLSSNATLVFGNQPKDLENQIVEAGIRNVYDGGKIQLNLGNTNIQTQAQNQTHQAYGIFTSSVAESEVLLDMDKVLIFNVYQNNGQEGSAFGVGKNTQNGKKGAIHMQLSKNSNLIFNSNAGELKSLSGSNANISLAGNKARVLPSTTSLQLRSLSVDDFSLADSTITLFASQQATISSNGYAEGRAYTHDKKEASQGGSDRIIINASSKTPTNNNLALVMDHFSQSQTYAVLAQVKSKAKDNVVFNNLQNVQSTTIKAYAGFESADVTLRREDSGDAYYFIDLSPTNRQINQEHIAPTLSAMLSNYTLYLANFNSLNKRMGELRDNSGEQGVWARVFGGELSNEFGAGSVNYYATLQTGYDYGFSLSEGRDYLGVSLAYVYANNQVNSTKAMLGNDWVEGSTDSKTHGIELGVYNSYVQDNGFYTDTIFKLGYLSSSFELFNQAQGSEIGNLSTILSQEVGYRYDFSSVEGLYLTPSVEITFGYLNGSDFTQSLTTATQTYALYSQQDDIFITRGKIEATLGYFFATDFGSSQPSDSKRGASLYLGLGYEYDYISGGEVSYQATQSTPQTQSNAIGSDGRMVLNLGSNVLINDTARVYFDFESNFFGKINKTYQLNAGVRISLGNINPSKQATQEAPLKIQN